MKFFHKHRFAISVGIGIALCSISLSVWKLNHDRLTISLSGKVADTATLIIQQVDGILDENVGRLENLKHRLEISGGDYFEYWDEDAARIVQTESAFRFVEWIDSTMVITRVVPEKDNKEAQGLDISQLDYRNSDWIKARDDSIYNMTPWLNLTQGGQAFLVDEPVYINGNFWGTVTAGMDFTPRLDYILQGLDEYYVNITDDSGVVFYTFGTSEGIEDFQSMVVSEMIEVEDANQSVWTLTMVPNYLFTEVNSISDNNLALAFALVLSLLLAVSFFLIQQSSVSKLNSQKAINQLRGLIDAAPIGIFVIDSEGKVLDFWNPAAEKMLGWKKEEVRGKFLPHITEEYESDFRNIVEEAKKGGEVSNHEITRRRKDGTKRLFRIYISNLIGEEGKMMVLLEDVTKEKEYEEKLKRSLHEKDILLSEIHHRVKNNLAIIVGLIELQYKEVDDDTAKSLLDEAKNRIYSISGVHELLYRTEDFSNISLKEYVNELIDRLQQTYENDRKPVKIEKDVPDAQININQAVPLGLLLNELITNSYKHAFVYVDDPKLSLKISREEGFVEISYEDNGNNFKVENFEKSSTLGATIIHTSLEQLSSEYTIYSNPGFGIQFKFPVQAKGPHSNM